jgi:Mg2+/Co2+ transporter CorB
MLALREEIAGAIALGHSEGAVEKEDRDRLLGALDLSHRTVDEIMRHRRQIEMIDADSRRARSSPGPGLAPHPPADLPGATTTSWAWSTPRTCCARWTGWCAAKRPGQGIEALDIVKVAMKPYFIPDTTTLDEQMREFLKRRTHFALVVDEYGALQGLITLEDILEEIVGDITDEFDVVKKDAGLKPDRGGDYIVDGAMTIRDLNRATDWRPAG